MGATDLGLVAARWRCRLAALGADPVRRAGEALAAPLVWAAPGAPPEARAAAQAAARVWVWAALAAWVWAAAWVWLEAAPDTAPEAAARAGLAGFGPAQTRDWARALQARAHAWPRGARLLAAAAAPAALAGLGAAPALAPWCVLALLLALFHCYQLREEARARWAGTPLDWLVRWLRSPLLVWGYWAALLLPALALWAGGLVLAAVVAAPGALAGAPAAAEAWAALRAERGVGAWRAVALAAPGAAALAAAALAAWRAADAPACWLRALALGANLLPAPPLLRLLAPAAAALKN